MTQPVETTNNQSILVVDDNVDAALTLSMLLRLKKYTVQTAYSGQQALQMAEAQRPQVVLLDISMPGLDGYDTCRLLRQQPAGDELLIIALTGYGQEEDRQRTRTAGFNGHLVKPVELDVLLKTMTTLQQDWQKQQRE
ncbi:response regulator [Spirosoma rhododendri]|uniref:Response regulator n=1 Tax=Spirosoma rhododendri TaxID=2728024 RepID=A0A7L5DSF7_9BACT|nr:response regulator [Spirosoma rhododendri]QJD79498.1 response regulator [Spirosoma rhododendri]